MDFKEALEYAFEHGDLPIQEEPPSEVDPETSQAEDLHAESQGEQVASPPGDSQPEEEPSDAPTGEDQPDPETEEPAEVEVPVAEETPPEEPPSEESSAEDEDSSSLTEENLLDLNTYFRTAIGRDLSASEAQEVLDAYIWQSSLQPDQVERVREALNGPSPAQPEPAHAQAPAAAPTGPALDLSGFDLLPEDQQRLAQVFETYISNVVSPLQEQITDSETLIRQYQSQQVNAEAERLDSEIADGLRAFADSHPEFSPEEVAGLQARIQTQGTFGTFLTAHNNDGRKAAEAAMETTMFADETLRAKYLAKAAATEAEAQAEDAERQQNLAALGGANNAGTPDIEDQNVPTNEDTLQGALARALSA